MWNYKKQLNDTYEFPYTYDVIKMDGMDRGSQNSIGSAGGTVTLIPDDAVLNDNVVKKIIGTTVSEVDGVLGLRGSVMENITGAFSGNEVTRGITLHTEGSQAEVELKIIVLYGKSIPEIIRSIQQNVHSALLNMAGLNASRIQVDITDVMTREEYEDKYNKGRDSE